MTDGFNFDRWFYYCLQRKEAVRQDLMCPWPLDPNEPSRVEYLITVRNEVAKVMFLQECVCPLGGGVVTQHALQVVSQHALQQVSGGGIPVCLAGFQAHTQGGSRGGSGQGGLQAHNQRGYMLQGGCRRYASYWNAFLLLF